MKKDESFLWYFQKIIRSLDCRLLLF